MNLLIDYVETDTTVSNFCGRSFDGLSESVRDLTVLIGLLLQTGDKFKGLVDCSVVVPIYTETVYEATCSHATKAIGWIYISGLLLALCSFAMITLRSSTLLSEVEERAPETPKGVAVAEIEEDSPERKKKG
jgi:hypothetical protein